MASTDLGSSLSAMSFEQEIAIPAVNLNTSQEFDIDVINGMVNAMVSFAGGIDGGDTLQQVNFASNFDHVIYNNGLIEITTTDTSLSGRVALYSAATDSDAQTTKIAQTTISGGKATLAFMPSS